MKKYGRVFFMVFLLAGFPLLSSAQSIDINKITGFWILDLSAQMKNNPKSNDKINKLDKKHKDQYLETQKSRAYVFYENGNFETSWVSYGGSQLVYGKWELDKNNDLRIVFPDKTQLLYKTKLTEFHCILTSSVKDGDSDRRLYLKRIDR